MKKSVLIIAFVCFVGTVFAQNTTSPLYTKLVSKADSLYGVKNYKASAFTFSAAFKANSGYAVPRHRYNAACAWALAGYPDSAFHNLDILAQKAGYASYDHIIIDADLISLHTDKRWAPVLAMFKANQDKAEAHYNKPLQRELDSIYDTDQGGRQQLDPVEQKYGKDSKEIKQLWVEINRNDSINLIKVKQVLDKYGWLGPDVVGSKGSVTLFLVIQHADAKDRDKYLPMMREAVKKGNAQGSQLALMEDRSALEHGKKQIYGSQIGRDEKTGKYYIDPIEDEPNVDKRRAAVGLDSLEDYAQQWGIVYKLPKQ